MSVTGQESISCGELEIRLDLDKDDLDRQAEASSREDMLTNLMISFFFKGGHTNLGCEFLHKSFREYLFAEGIIATLKDYGQERLNSGSRHPLATREPYWADFKEDDPRFSLSRRLSEALGPL